MSIRTIHKAQVDINGGFITMPFGARVLSVQLQYNYVTVWYEFDAEQTRKLEHKITAVGTGHPISRYVGEYLTTLQFDGGRLVLHYYLDFVREIPL